VGKKDKRSFMLRGGLPVATCRQGRGRDPFLRGGGNETGVRMRGGGEKIRLLLYREKKGKKKETFRFHVVRGSWKEKGDSFR